MGIISRGFGGGRRESVPGLPPGQYLTYDFPVLSAGPTPRIPLERWRFTLTTESGEQKSWDWQEFTALPTEDVSTDIHCVTKWSKLPMARTAVSRRLTWQIATVTEIRQETPTIQTLILEVPDWPDHAAAK